MPLRSQRTREFKRLFARLPAHVQQQAREAYQLFRANPHHPSLNFERLISHSDKQGMLYSTRIGRCYRAVARREGDTLVWFYIGSHENYNNFF